MTHLTESEANELRRLCEAAGSDVQSKGSILPITAAKLARAAQIMFPALLKQLEELRAERAVLQRENLDALYGWDAEHRRAEKAEAELKEAEAAQASTARRVAEGIAREAKLREALEPFALIFIEIIEPSISSCGSAPQYSTIKTCTDYFERARAALKEGQE